MTKFTYPQLAVVEGALSAMCLEPQLRSRVAKALRLYDDVLAAPYDLRKDTFMGRPYEDWAMIDEYMRSARMTAPEVCNRLRGHRGTAMDPIYDLEVFDKVNQTRLLGQMRDIKKKVQKPQGRSIKFAAMPPVRLSACTAETIPSSPLWDHVTFDIEWRGSGWTQEGFLSTSAPLKVLLALDDFRLPGETDREAGNRRHNQR